MVLGAMICLLLAQVVQPAGGDIQLQRPVRGKLVVIAVIHVY